MADPPFDAEKLAVVGKRGPGRPRKLSPEARGMLLTFLCNSLSRADACKLVGVSVQTLANEMKRDPAFKLEVHRAELSGKAQAAACVTEAAKSDPKLALLYLERRWPAEWAKRKVLVELTGAGIGDGKKAVAALLGKLNPPASPAPATPEASPAEVAAAPPEGAG